MVSLIIGDIHGCYDELQALLDKAGLGVDDEIIAIGDMVDRGPKSAQVLDFFRTTPNARSIMGNHERKHVRSYEGDVPPSLSQLITRIQIGEDEYPAAVEYMSGLPHYLDLPNALLVHGFFEPRVPVDLQRENVIVGVMSGEQYLDEKYDQPWYTLYDGDKPLIVGHRNWTGTFEPLIYENRVYGIDTRCVYGGTLTGLLLPSFQLMSVSSPRSYWASLKQEYAYIDPFPKTDD